MLIISCHGDTNFASHKIELIQNNSVVLGELDNFAGVYCVINALFSGKMNYDHVRVEFTHGEEIDFAGAREVCKTMDKNDLVVVVDVTGTKIGKGFVIEKCKNNIVEQWLNKTLAGLPYMLYKNCPDPICNEDETDVYKKVTPFTFFLGVPVVGGDYNAGRVKAKMEDLKFVQQALIKIAEGYPELASQTNGKLKPTVYLKPNPDDNDVKECDYCEVSIGDQTHWHCVNETCHDYDLCDACHSSGKYNLKHKTSHAMEKVVSAVESITTTFNNIDI